MYRQCSTKPGYSLIELSIIIALIALCATFSIALIPGIKSNAVHAELDLLYQTCLYLKHNALMSGSDQQLVIDLEHNRYTYNKHAVKLAPGVRFGRPSSIPSISGQQGVDTTGICTFKNCRITFYKDGAIDAGSLYFTDAAGRRGAALTIAVGEYAYIRRYIYRNGWQLW